MHSIVFNIQFTKVFFLMHVQFLRGVEPVEVLGNF